MTDVLEVRNLYKRYGGLVATNGVNLSVRPGEMHAIIGPNGAGKTTLISQLQGMVRPDAGEIFIDGVNVTATPAHQRAGLGVARSFQIASLIPDFSVLDHAAFAVQAQLGHSFRFWRRADREEILLAPAREAVEAAGLGARMHSPARDLSHGERRQLELAIALAQRPKILLLDEPMAGMGKQDGQRMTQRLADLKGRYSMLLIEHDMAAVFSLADRLSVLVSGAIIKTGTADEIRNDPQVRAAYLGHG
ncbi:MAG: ABC transporter ATP-binding protein [Hyphomicrobiales bacterium]|nr:ABC transporter ATP-binding protein [Hyphomicrobiales bacterium]